ncbi:MAG: FixH family protein [Saprospiraceae bacterium]
MKFKFHWGWAIAIFYSLFVLAMIYLVLYSKTVDHSLERDNYYDYDIGYEKLIGEKKRNANDLKTPVIINYNGGEKAVEFNFPEYLNGISGEIWFYRVNNEKLDVKVPINVDSLNHQKFDVSDFVRGKWTVSVDWVSEGKDYLNSYEFYMN